MYYAKSQLRKPGYSRYTAEVYYRNKLEDKFKEHFGISKSQTKYKLIRNDWIKPEYQPSENDVYQFIRDAFKDWMSDKDLVTKGIIFHKIRILDEEFCY